MSDKKLTGVVEGLFFGIRVMLVDQTTIRIYDTNNTPFYDFKPICDKISRYVIDEGFIKTTKPRVEIYTN
jgi:hypothetical protein